MNEKIAAVLERATAGEDMWKDPKFEGDYMDVAVSINRLGAFKAILNAAGVEYETMIEDLGLAIDENMESGKNLTRLRLSKILTHAKFQFNQPTLVLMISTMKSMVLSRPIKHGKRTLPQPTLT